MMDLLRYESDYCVVYTDGSCRFNGRTNARAGIGVYFGDNHAWNVSEPLIGKQTNNLAELNAAKRAIDIALDHKIDKLCIRTDSEYVFKGMTVWIQDWAASNWQKPKKNPDLFKELHELVKKLDVKWEHVPGHSGIPGNEAANLLATRGADMHFSQEQ